MAFSATLSTKEPRSFSIGPLKMEIHTFTMLSDDTSGTVTAKSLERVDHAIVVGGVNMSAAPSISGKTVTLTFEDIDDATPTHEQKNVAGQVILLGR